MPSEGILALAANFQQNRQGFSVDGRVQEVIDSMNDDLRRDPSLTEMAASVRLSPSRFSHLFKVDGRVSLALSQTAQNGEGKRVVGDYLDED